jgi:protein-disulfide isomerase
MTTKTQQRRDRQERARALREAERKSARRRRNLLTTGVVVLVLLVVVGVGIAVSASRSSTSGPVLQPKDAVTTGAPVAVGGMLIGNPAAPVTMDAYEDFTCPICGEFEKADGASLTTLIQNGTVKVRYHMMSFIDDHNGGTYSHRSANAFAAADTYAGPMQALALHAALYANQPDESSAAGLTDSKITDLASSAGITSQQFVDAVTKNSFKGWVGTVADDASKAGVTGTPTIFLNEKQIQTNALVNASGAFDPALLTQQIDAAKGAAK